MEMLFYHIKHVSGSEHRNVKLLSKFIYQTRADDAQPFDLVQIDKPLCVCGK